VVAATASGFAPEPTRARVPSSKNCSSEEAVRNAAGRHNIVLICVAVAALTIVGIYLLVS
jgi:hypothetical protein